MKEMAWDWGNEIIYKMCRENPEHNEISVILGKVWIIGRSYSAAIERGAGENITKGVSFYEKTVAPVIKKSRIDKYLSPLIEVDRINEENIEQALHCHSYLTSIFSKISTKNKRSLASKYLHFHAPNAFFIYDSIANGNIRKILRLNGQSRFRRHEGYDAAYSAFVVRCLYLRDTFLKERGFSNLSPRDIDKFLLNPTLHRTYIS